MKTFQEFMSYFDEDFGSEYSAYQQSPQVRRASQISAAKERSKDIVAKQKETTAEHSERARDAAAAATKQIEQQRAEYKQRQELEKQRKQEEDRQTQESVEVQMEQIPHMKLSTDDRFRQSRVHTRRSQFLSSSGKQKSSGYRSHQNVIGHILSRKTAE
jgi:uncharacterized lipoprotein YehR (DUF1307 family)